MLECQLLFVGQSLGSVFANRISEARQRWLMKNSLGFMQILKAGQGRYSNAVSWLRPAAQQLASAKRA
jgi:hypothetical protein